MVSTAQLLTYGSLLVLILAIVAARWSQWTEFDAAVDDLADKLFQSLKTDVVAFALPAAYARWVLPCPWQEPRPLKVVASGAMGATALFSLTAARQAAAQGTFRGISDFGGLFVSHIASYGVAPLLARDWLSVMGVAVLALVLLTGLQKDMALETVQAVAALSAGLIAHGRFALRWHWILSACVGAAASVPYLAYVLNWLLPLRELAAAYQSIESIVGTPQFEEEVCELLVVTGYVQVSLGYVGIWCMRSLQARTNLLLDVADGKLNAWSFVQRVGLYMWSVAAPYMVQRTIMETANALSLYIFLCKLDLHLRVDTFFSSGDYAYNRLEVVLDSDHTVDAYAESVTELMYDCYLLVEKKLFGLPNILLMSDTLLSQPGLMMAVLPVSVGLDFGRARAFSILTRNIEQVTKYLRTRLSRRRKIEEHDVEHAETISRTGAATLVASRWENLSEEIFQLTAWKKCLSSFRRFLDWIYYTNIVGVGIECALARMMELGSIAAADLAVYAQVIEDSVDFLLTRYREARFLHAVCLSHPSPSASSSVREVCLYETSAAARKDARLAQMVSNQERLAELHTSLASFQQRPPPQSDGKTHGKTQQL